MAYLDSGRYYCFSCHRSGNALDLWAAARHLSLYEAARDLCCRTAHRNAAHPSLVTARRTGLPRPTLPQAASGMAAVTSRNQHASRFSRPKWLDS